MYILYKCIFLKGRAEHNQAAAPKSLRDSKSMQTSEGDKGDDTEMNTEVFSVRGASRGPGGGDLHESMHTVQVGREKSSA